MPDEVFVQMDLVNHLDLGRGARVGAQVITRPKGFDRKVTKCGAYPRFSNETW